MGVEHTKRLRFSEIEFFIFCVLLRQAKLVLIALLDTVPSPVIKSLKKDTLLLLLVLVFLLDSQIVSHLTHQKDQLIMVCFMRDI